MDYGNVAWQGVAGAAGPVVGKVVGAAAPRIGAALAKGGVAEALPFAANKAEEAALKAGAGGVGADAAVQASSFGLSPRVLEALKQHISGRDEELALLRKDAQDLGVELSLGQATGSTAVQQAERQLARQPEGADAVAALRRSQNEEQIPGAVRKLLDDSEAPNLPQGQQVGAFRDAAEKVVEKTFKDQSKEAGPVYAKALDEKEPFWSDELTDIMKRPSMQAGWREAQKDAEEEGRILPELFAKAPDDTMVLNEQNVTWRDWQNIKVGMRKAREAETDQTTGKMTPDGVRLNNTMHDMMGVLYKNNPEWRAADAAYGSASEATEAVLQGGAGLINKMTGADRQNMVNKIFSGQNLMPEEVAAMRRQFVYAGKSEEWLGGVRSYISDKLADAMVPNQNGELSNVGGKLYKGLWGDQRQSDIIKAAFGGSNADSFIQRWDKLGNVLRAAARQLPEGAATATDTNAPSLVAKAAGAGLSAAKALLHPTASTADFVDGLSKMKDPAQIKKLTETLFTPEGEKLLKALQPTTPGTPKANSILTQMFIQAGVVAGAGAAARSDE
jgi:hypothetical protein